MVIKVIHPPRPPHSPTAIVMWKERLLSSHAPSRENYSWFMESWFAFGGTDDKKHGRDCDVALMNELPFEGECVAITSIRNNDPVSIFRIDREDDNAEGDEEKREEEGERMVESRLARFEQPAGVDIKLDDETKGWFSKEDGDGLAPRVVIKGSPNDRSFYLANEEGVITRVAAKPNTAACWISNGSHQTAELHQHPSKQVDLAPLVNGKVAVLSLGGFFSIDPAVPSSKPSKTALPKPLQAAISSNDFDSDAVFSLDGNGFRKGLVFALDGLCGLVSTAGELVCAKKVACDRGVVCWMKDSVRFALFANEKMLLFDSRAMKECVGVKEFGCGSGTTRAFSDENDMLWVKSNSPETMYHYICMK